LADGLARRGHAVTWLGAESAIRPQLAGRTESFVSYEDLANQLHRLLGEVAFDAVIQAAAVSDFSVDRIERDGKTSAVAQNKLSSEAGMSLHLKPNRKLLPQLRAWSANPDIQVIGFKLTHGASAEERARAVSRLFDGANPNAVVHNDLGEITGDRHPYTLHVSAAESLACADSGELADGIHCLLENDS
jgi:phosphopantothenoylcysteine decarboxylase/phosphopantothenate--cysteine ligase